MGNKIWEEKEIEVLINMNEEFTIDEICEKIPTRTKLAIKNKLQELKIKYKHHRKERIPVQNINGKSFICCTKCNLLKEYNKKNFPMGKVCNECILKDSLVRRYKRDYGIILELEKGINTYTPEQWYEFMFKGIINAIPTEISTRKNWIKIFKYVVNKNNLSNREDILKIDTNFIKKYKLTTAQSKIDSKVYEIINICFPELQILPWELKVTNWNYFKNKNNIIKAVDWLLEKNNIDINTIHKIGLNFEELFIKNGLSCLISNHFKGSLDLFEWYLKKKGYHFNIHDKKFKPNGYWMSKENYIIQFRKYITYLMKNNLITNTKTDIQVFLRTSFIETSEFKMLIKANKDYGYYDSLFDCFCELYPEFGLKVEDFIPIGCDGVTKLNSYQEKIAFDYIFNELNLKTIKAIGLKKEYKYANKEFNESYFPDFIISNVLDKPIIIEYYGLYDLKRADNILIKNYIEKTKRKNEFYRNNQSIYFIDLYKEDLDNNCFEVKNKLMTLLKGGEIIGDNALPVQHC